MNNKVNSYADSCISHGMNCSAEGTNVRLSDLDLGSNRGLIERTNSDVVITELFLCCWYLATNHSVNTANFERKNK
jgi:hypothetical protein